jgi:hypothetical protein
MENQDSMARTATDDGLQWKYTGYLGINVSTPVVIGSGGNDYQVAASQSQTLYRAVAFLAPKTLAVDMTQQHVRVWSRDLVVPSLVFYTADWGDSIHPTTIWLRYATLACA